MDERRPRASAAAAAGAAATPEALAMRSKAPTLAWLLTALTCFLAGLALDEGRHQAAVPPQPPPAVAPPTATVADASTPPAEPTLLPTLTPTPTPVPATPWNYG